MHEEDQANKFTRPKTFPAWKFTKNGNRVKLLGIDSNGHYLSMMLHDNGKTQAMIIVESTLRDSHDTYKYAVLWSDGALGPKWHDTKQTAINNRMNNNITAQPVHVVRMDTKSDSPRHPVFSLLAYP